jgi:CshA-type fibril repeat protein
LSNGVTNAGDGLQPGGAINTIASSPSTSTNAQCLNGAGTGGSASATLLSTKAGNGCAAIKYTIAGTTYFDTYYFTGSNQTWTVPNGVTTIELHLVGAGGGGSSRAAGGAGGGGGYAAGSYAVTSGQQFTVIVGEGGGGVLGSVSSGCYYTPSPFGGGGKGGSCFGGGQPSSYAAGGGRTAIRLLGSADDIATAAGGGGGGYGTIGGAAGGTNGSAGGVNGGGGGTPTAGGTGGISGNSFPGLAGSKYTGGNSRDEGGGGGGGWWGGGGGGDNGGGGGGSSYVGLLTNGSTTAGSGTAPGLQSPVNTAAPVITGSALVGVTLTAASGTWATSGTSTWQWQSSTDGVTFSNVSGQVATTTTTTGALFYRIIETRSNLLGTVSATSNVIKAVAPVTVDCTPTAGTFTHCKRFNYYGAAQTFTVPNDMPVGSTFTIEVWGAGGGGVCCNYFASDSGGGAGGYVKSTVTIQSPSEVFTVVVGERGESRDTASGYGGGGAGGPSLTVSANAGSSGGGMSGLFAGSGTTTPVLIAGGGGGASPGINADAFAGGGGADSAGQQSTNASLSGRAGTLLTGGAPATTTTQCAVTATSGSQYQGGRGCGTTTVNSEGGGGGGGGWFGGGGGNHQTSTSGAQNGGGGGGSGYRDVTRTSLLTATAGGQGIAQPLSGGRTSDQYITFVGTGGSGYVGTLANAVGGHGMVVVQWALPPTARADAKSGGTALAISLSPASNDTATSGATINASSVRLCAENESAPNCTATSRTVTGEGTYSVNTSTGVVTFTGVAGFVGTSTLTYSIADSRGTRASNTISFTTLAPPTARPDESAAQKSDNQSVSPLSNDAAAGSATLDTSSLKLCGVSPLETTPSCSKTSITIANEGTYAVSNGRVTFTANSTFVGTRVLTYIVSDSNSQIASSTITFTALPPPAVSASAESLTVSYASTATFTPLANDSAGLIPADYTTQGTVSLNSSSLNLCDAGETISTGCTKSSITVTNEGTWTLNGTTVTFVPLTTFSGTATPMSYVVCNTISGSWAPATPPSTCGSSVMTVSVNSPIAPVPQADSTSGQLGVMLSYSPLSNDQGTALSPSRMRLCDPSETAPACNSTAVVIANEGTWNLNTSTGVVLFIPLALFHGSATPITYTATDIVGTAFSSNIGATIVAPAAPSASADVGSGTAGGSVTFTPLANDSGTDLSPSSLNLCGPNDTPPTCTESTLVINGEGTWTVNSSTGDIVFTPVSGFVGTATAVRYSSQDILSRKTSSTLTASVAAIAAPSAPTLATASDTGISSTDNITRDTTPTIGSTGANDGDTVTVTATQGSTTVTCSYVASPSTSGCVLSTLTTGTWSVTTQRTDVQNNVSAASAATSVVIDTTAPSSPSTPDLDSSSDDGTSSTDNRTSDNTPAIGVGGGISGAEITVSATNGPTTLSCTYDPSVSSTCNLPTLADGTWTVSATVSDTAGNTSAPSASLSIVIDTATTPTTSVSPTTSTTTTTIPVIISNTTTTTTSPSTTIPSTTTTTTLPNSKIPYDISELETVVDDIATVAGMPKGGWVKVDKTNTSITITTSDGLLIKIGAKVKSSSVLRLNSRGMPIFEANDFITIAGGGLMPATPASTWLFSTPKQLGQLTTDRAGSFNEEYSIGEDVEVGDHTAQLNGIAPDGTLRVVEVAVEIIATPTEVLPTTSGNSSETVPSATPLSTSATIALLASALALLAISRQKTSALSSQILLSQSTSNDSSNEDGIEREEAGGDIASVKVSFGSSVNDDRIDRLRVPRIQRIDRFMNHLSSRIVQLSPMLARATNDGAYARSLLGLLWPLLPMAGIALGILSAFNTDFVVMAPALSLVIAIAILGVLDAFAGIFFAISFGVAVLIGGGFSSVHSLRGLLGIAVFSFAPVMIAAATRPFRRTSDGKHPLWNRTVDFVLTALFGSWAAGSMYSALPSLTTFKPDHSDRVDLIHVVFICAIAFRWLTENFARLYMPRRLRIVEVEEFEDPSRLQRISSYLVRTGVFVFVAVVFIGNNWALWIGAAMYLVPKLVDEFSDLFPNLPIVYRFVPRNLFRVVAMLFVCLWWGNIVDAQFGDSKNVLLYAFVLLSIPGLILGTIDWFAREGKKWESTSVSRVLGIIVLVIGILSVRGVLP